MDAYEKRVMPQNGEVAVLECSPIWKKMRKSFKTLCELKAQFHSEKEVWKWEAMTTSAGKGTLLFSCKKSSNRIG